MANHKNTLKAHKQDVVRRARNRGLRTRLRRALKSLRAAIDQRFAPLDTPIGDAREIALFPPVTGG